MNLLIYISASGRLHLCQVTDSKLETVCPLMGGHTATVRCLQWDHNVSVFVQGIIQSPLPRVSAPTSPKKSCSSFFKLFQSETGISFFDPNNDVKTEVLNRVTIPRIGVIPQELREFPSAQILFFQPAVQCLGIESRPTPTPRRNAFKRTFQWPTETRLLYAVVALFSSYIPDLVRKILLPVRYEQ